MTFQLLQKQSSDPPPRVSSRVADMGALSDECVVIRLGSKPGDPNVITVSCSDELGLACNLARSIFEFGLEVVCADFSTDGRWCLMLFWVTPRQGPAKAIKWALLKKRLVADCPSPSSSLIMSYKANLEYKRDSYLLQTCSADRAGLINDLAQTLWELEVDVHKVNALTTPDGHAVDVFYLSDNRKFPSVKTRQEDVCDQIKSVLGATQSLCQLSLTTDNDFQENLDVRMFPTLPDDLFRESFTSSGDSCPSTDPEFSVNIDNSLSPGHTLLQITFSDRKGILYDCMRVLRDLNLRIAYGRLSTTLKGSGDLDLFILQANGNKLVDPDKQKCLADRLKMDICDPIRVMIVNRGPDTELIVATTVEKNGCARPRILYDVTLVLKMLDICIFKADSEKIAHGDRLWEIYRFLLLEKPNASFKSSRTRTHIVERVKSVLMGVAYFRLGLKRSVLLCSLHGCFAAANQVSIWRKVQTGGLDILKSGDLSTLIQPYL
ncbi:hypothetical protein GOP47_0019703 [Adiantum capillus-veneris]|uniref:ACT domain-containing protein n=1 Tax=Adiantum capillus-veneris TaxID=13818 RepID=A0A9D4UBJ2_ADICA|nr:hypothetical protein GOP47_0019703 [Adiantum capillus-veneris]